MKQNPFKVKCTKLVQASLDYLPYFYTKEVLQMLKMEDNATNRQAIRRVVQLKSSNLQIALALYETARTHEPTLKKAEELLNTQTNETN